MANVPASRAGPALAVVGMSVRATCGVHDHADILAAELEREGIACSSHWLVRRESSLAGSRREVGEWVSALPAALEREQPSAIVLHYSVFSLSHRGVPLFVHPLLAQLRSTAIPIVTVMHEFAYPWNYGGARGLVWAVSQRAVLVELMRTSSGALVTAEWRRSWLISRRWLPRRPVVLAPVFSNLPPPHVDVPRRRPGPLIGLFGYSYQGTAVTLVLDALLSVRSRSPSARLLLLGAPGSDSPAGGEWQREARVRGLQDAVSFTGRLPAQELSDALAGCDLLLCVDEAGPSPRKGTLAGSLASGRPVLAIDGPLTWRELTDAGAADLAAPRPDALADSICSLLDDPAQLDLLGARGRGFSELHMGVDSTAAAIRSLLAL